MPSETDNVSTVKGDDFGAAWERFVTTLRQLLSAPQNERVIEAFIPLRNATLDALGSPDLVAGIQKAWVDLHTESRSPVTAHLLLTELLAFPAAMESKTNEEKTATDPARSSLLRKRLLGIGGTAIESINDLLDALPFHWKAVLKVGKEVVDIFRGE